MSILYTPGDIVQVQRGPYAGRVLRIVHHHTEHSEYEAEVLENTGYIVIRDYDLEIVDPFRVATRAELEEMGV